jgi:2-amino-4-hydroxy-6-hydroxymethyldihydropteridine diphosphokinase / dihydropteroate synthase
MIYLSIGSNLGNRLENVRNAIRLLKKKVFNNLRCAPILETEAITLSGSPAEWNKPFLNTIVYGESSLTPEDLLQKLKEIEIESGHPAAHKKWAPRIIDLDILLWDNLTVNTPLLVIPHKELCNRSFLVHLFALINPSIRYPEEGSCHRCRGKTFGEIARSYSNINECFNKSLTLYPKLVGVVNVTPDSFSDGGKYFEHDKAIAKALELASDGATVVELGAQSTRPGATIISEDEEFERLSPVLDGLLKKMKNGVMKISVDTFYPKVVRKLLKNYPVSWINDVKGEFDNETLEEIAAKGCKIVVMHSLSVPVKKGEYLSDEIDPSDEIIRWAEETLSRLVKCGFQKDSVILDPGIGFGKSSYQSLALIRAAKQIKKIGCPVFFGHSRKSYLAAFCKSSSVERDLETIAVSDYLNECEIDYLRVHNVKHHQSFFVTKQLIQEGASYV